MFFTEQQEQQDQKTYNKVANNYQKLPKNFQNRSSKNMKLNSI